MNPIEFAEFKKEREENLRLIEDLENPVWSWDHLKYDRCHNGGTDPKWIEYVSK